MSDCCSGTGCGTGPDAGAPQQPRNRAERRAAARTAREAKR